jgi:hypothetical protein
MEEDDLTTSFNTSLTNLSTSSSSPLSSSSSSSNYQTLVNTNISRNANNDSLNGGSPPPPPSSQLTASNAEQCPFAVFLFRSNSGVEMYEERRIMLDRACKIGRSVAKVRPEPNNAIFDCKVLSRNHALLWHENNKVS